MRISTAESEIMKALWAKSPLTAEEITAILADDQNWAEGTVKALLNRLLKKNAIAADKDGRRFLYRPVVVRATMSMPRARACWIACSMAAWPHWSATSRSANG